MVLQTTSPSSVNSEASREVNSHLDKVEVLAASSSTLPDPEAQSKEEMESSVPASHHGFPNLVEYDMANVDVSSHDNLVQESRLQKVNIILLLVWKERGAYEIVPHFEDLPKVLYVQLKANIVLISLPFLQPYSH
ncbi:hypothetical protein Syun_018891 [Stephania yunnanensis]|uniref:Uncharacterized protein n=1 Tax=Stephania yunnanensis TaxID=152371 RepID=A0AAP0IT33_9MAGN